MLTLYLHIPFCKARCSYCDFYLVTGTEHIDAFFSALSLETASRSADLKGRTVGAIHIGGGTPSMVPVHYLAGWLEHIASLCSFTPDIEIALEANPEDLGGKKMDELRAAGITRLSIGAQSFMPAKLFFIVSGAHQYGPEPCTQTTLNIKCFISDKKRCASVNNKPFG